jgi:2-polyprenyl-6-methoxyphenol hydroxylase-like FAD-dependent oxidoreductase
MSGLALAHGLVNDPQNRFEVTLYERDTVAFDLERGGYQLRMAAGGVYALKDLTNLQTWRELQRVWGGDSAKAPAMVDPKTYTTKLKLGEVKIYPKSCGIARVDLKKVLIKDLQDRDLIRFSCPLDRYEVVESAQEKGEHEVLLHFKNPDSNPSVRADIVVAADGSNSVVNRQAGINNKCKMNSWTLIQSRGSIDEQTYRKLPASLKSQGSNMFLAGAKYSGFASVYQQSELTSTSEHPAGEYQLFWSALVPKEIGDNMVRTAGDDKMKLIKLLSSHVVDDLHYNPQGLPYIYSCATEHVRTGAVTTSLKPTVDWRGGKAANGRILIIGDAIHPMTPGRGMGANQALMDAGYLCKIIKQTHFSSDTPTDEDMQKLATKLDTEMYDRAFKMVKASEDMISLDLTTTGGLIKLTIGKIVLTTIGLVVSALELSGLRKPGDINFQHPDEAQ